MTANPIATAMLMVLVTSVRPAMRMRTVLACIQRRSPSRSRSHNNAIMNRECHPEHVGQAEGDAADRGAGQRGQRHDAGEDGCAAGRRDAGEHPEGEETAESPRAVSGARGNEGRLHIRPDSE
jgi:hypothetical protein